MNNEDLKGLLGICEKKIDNNMNEREIKDFIVLQHGEEVFKLLEDKIVGYLERKKKIRENSRKYWMILCNPSDWGEDTERYQVNQLLYMLNENTVERWKIHGTNVFPFIKVGDRGIIKVGNDGRSKYDRIDEEDNEIPKLDAGIYGLFEVIEDSSGKHTMRNEIGETFVYIKCIDNFFAKDEVILKEKAFELLGKTTFNTMSSKKLEIHQYDRIVNFRSQPTSHQK